MAGERTQRDVRPDWSPLARWCAHFRDGTRVGNLCGTITSWHGSVCTQAASAPGSCGSAAAARASAGPRQAPTSTRGEGRTASNAAGAVAAKASSGRLAGGAAAHASPTRRPFRARSRPSRTPSSPPLTAPVPDGAPYGKARRRGLAAQDRLDARKKHPQGKAVKPAKSQRAAGAERGRAPTAPPRRAAKRAGAAAGDVAAERRLQVRITDLERQFAAGKGTPADRALLTERLAASRDTLAALRNRD